MARILALDEVPVALRNHLVRSLRSLDEAVLLPQAERHDDTGVYKNVVFRIAGAEPHVPVSVFSPSWFTGISAVKVDGAFVTRILNDAQHRKQVLQRLRDIVPSEMADSSLHVGPALDGDDNDRDKDEWTAGFDGPGCFVGLFCADHSSAPVAGKRGMDRVHQTSYLVCKAGAGVAGATFHLRLMEALKKGQTLEDCLERSGSSPGPAALRRVSMAGSRNRARILELAGKALGMPIMDTVPDQSSRGRYRGAVTQVDVSVNAIRRLEDAPQPTYQYTTCVDAGVSQGLMSMSNIADGVVLMLSAGGEVRQTLRNEAHCSVPYASRRLVTDKDLIARVTKEHREAIEHGDWAHPDHEFVRDRFSWRSRSFAGLEETAARADIEPLALWGSHDREDYLAKFARELGVAQCQVVRLRPTVVCLAGVEGGKLRAALRNIHGSGVCAKGGGAMQRIQSRAAPPPPPAGAEPRSPPTAGAATAEPAPAAAAAASTASSAAPAGSVDDLFAARARELQQQRHTQSAAAAAAAAAEAAAAATAAATAAAATAAAATAAAALELSDEDEDEDSLDAE